MIALAECARAAAAAALLLSPWAGSAGLILGAVVAVTAVAASIHHRSESAP